MHIDVWLHGWVFCVRMHARCIHTQSRACARCIVGFTQIQTLHTINRNVFFFDIYIRCAFKNLDFGCLTWHCLIDTVHCITEHVFVSLHEKCGSSLFRSLRLFLSSPLYLVNSAWRESSGREQKFKRTNCWCGWISVWFNLDFMLMLIIHLDGALVVTTKATPNKTTLRIQPKRFSVHAFMCLCNFNQSNTLAHSTEIE